LHSLVLNRSNNYPPFIISMAW